jgi:hypothetical protein
MASAATQVSISSFTIPNRWLLDMLFARQFFFESDRSLLHVEKQSLSDLGSFLAQ